VDALAESVKSENDKEENAVGKTKGKISVTANSDKTLSESEIKIDASDGKIRIEVVPSDAKRRIDLSLNLPERIRLKIQTGDGEAKVSGNFESVEIKTETGTIAADVPLENVKYDFVWTESRPRFLSDVELEKVKEKSAGKFVINGRIVGEEEEKGRRGEREKGRKGEEEKNEASENLNETTDNQQAKSDEKKKSKTKNQKPKTISLNFTTARGIILLNVPPNEVSSDLRERPLTEAAKAVIRSGDSMLMEAIRRASPKYFGDYAKTLPPSKREPSLLERKNSLNAPNANIKKVLARVTDINNRAIANLKKEDFEVSEAGELRRILAVEPTTAPFNLVLLLDVSGSVDNYVNFIRKAARNFVNTVEQKDKIAIIIFNDDIEVISNFTTDKTKLSESLDTFDAGGATAFYDALAYSLAETLRPLKGERTAIVALTDGDDNRSFLSFDSLLGSIQESGALIYPLYVPSALIASSANNNPNQTIDPLRTRYMGLTSKADGEGERLAQVSGGVYYPITQLSQIQKAYDDIVVQLRTAYTITFRSDLPETNDKTTASPRLKVKVKRDGAFVKLGSVVAVAKDGISGSKKGNFTQSSPGAQSKNKEVMINVDEISSINSYLHSANFTPLRKAVFQKLNYSPVLPSHFSNQSEEISGDISKISYKQFLSDDLRESKLETFDINKAAGAFLLTNGKERIAVSRWISPKRTRSYPYERVYDTLVHKGKKVAIIPVVKDEGLGGDRDFLQWDTVSLLSLLDVQVITAYYNSAEKNAKRADRITAQKLDNNYITARLKEVFNFKGTARDWNEREMLELKFVFEKAKLAYREISKKTKTYLHNDDALNELINYTATPQKFIEFSRRKSQDAQNREYVTEQPKESLATDTKAKVTINNALFGRYFLTCDETKIAARTVYLIEAKHSQREKLPNKNDVKDGFVKMMLYTNLNNVKVGAKSYKLKVMIHLTSSKLNGSINSGAGGEEVDKFLSDNTFDSA
ncbi:MAG: VWA domain-containing protein, partial [Pyrinomonadaceae bacterium]|nr:VWA domain-containing protein [Pyrinomonadaceae bacterium]